MSSPFVYDGGSNLTLAGTVTARIMNIGINTNYATYLSTSNVGWVGSNLITPAASGTISGVNITALNRRTRASYATANTAVSTWTPRASATNSAWLSVCWAPELSLFCAVAINAIMTSIDGINWISQTSPANMGWRSVCWAPELLLFCAVASSGTGNRVMTSPDGINWTARASGDDTRAWTSVCWASELSRFVVVATGFTNSVMISSDGITWIPLNSASNNDWRSVCWAPEISLFCAVSVNGTGNRVMTSLDGITWTSRTSAADNQWRTVCWSPELLLFCAVATSGTGNRVMTSPDGINWTPQSSVPNNDWYGVCWAPELSIFVAVANTGAGNRTMTSSDGVTWTIRTSAADNSWNSICWSRELSIFCAVASTGTGNRVMTSAIGLPAQRSTLLTNPSYMTMDQATGNVGIGTTTPLAKTHIYTTGATDILRVDDETAPDTTPFIIDQSGNVGIGTSQPTARLHVVGNAITSGTVSSGTGLMFRNRIINGDMRINQRGTSTNLASMTAVGTTFGYVTDRWGVYRTGFATGAQIAQGTNLSSSDLPFTDVGIKNFARVSRISGNTGTQAIYLAYGLESQDSQAFINKTVTLSFYYRTGANFSGTTLGAIISTGTGTDEAMQRGNSVTGLVNYQQSFAPSTNWVYATYTVQLNSTLNQVGTYFTYTPTGTAGANDWFDVTGVQLELGSVATPFEYRPYGIELQLCQRYFEIIQGYLIGTYILGGGFNHWVVDIKYSVSKRITTTDTSRFVISGTYITLSGSMTDYSLKPFQGIISRIDSVQFYSTVSFIPFNSSGIFSAFVQCSLEL